MVWQAMPIATQWNVTEPTWGQRNVHQVDRERIEAAVRAWHDPWRVVLAKVCSKEPDPPTSTSGERKGIGQARQAEQMAG
jgi:hypothetical protein